MNAAAIIEARAEAGSATVASRWPARRLRLKHHVFFRDTPDGVQFDGGSRGLLVPGAGIHKLLERVIGMMDQGMDLATMQSLLPERLQPTVLRLVDALDAHALLLDETDDAPWLDQAEAPEALREFVKYLQDRADPQTRRQRWRDWRADTVLLVGDGHAVRAAARALADSGVGGLRLRINDSGGVDGDALDEHLRASGVQGQRVDVRSAAWQAADFVGIRLAVWAADRSVAGDEAAAFERQATAHGATAVVALRAGGMALVAPPSQAGLPGVHDLLQWHTDGAAEAHSPASLALMGVVAAQAAMDHHFGIAPEQWQRQVRRISPYLEVSRHPLVSAGRTTLQPLSARPFADDVDSPPDRVLSGYEQQRIALAPWFDAVFGPFAWRQAGAGGALLSQLPLYHDAIAVRSPRAGAGGGVHVVGWGLDAEQAGTRALLLALNQLAARLDPACPAETCVSAFDTDRWQALALAHAVAGHADFAAQRRLAWLDLDGQLHDPAIHLLRQLMRHFAPAAPRVLLHWHPEFAACVAQVQLGTKLAGSACDATPLAAVREALGLACSRLQLGDDAPWRGPVWDAWDGSDAAPTQWRPVPEQPAGAVPAGVRWVAADTLNLPPSVRCGRAVVESLEVQR